MIGALMLDIAGTTLSSEDQQVLLEPQVGGVILFGRNIQTARQVRDLTDHIRQIRPELLIAVDQEGGRVQRLRDGFTRLPAMGVLGKLYAQQPLMALRSAETCGWLMASEVLAVGIDLSFAPVLDIDGISQVIGDRGFHTQPEVVIELSKAFMRGMHRAGMATTGKHFPGHGSTAADSHIAAPIDERTLAEIQALDLQVFAHTMPQLDALMPAHVIYPQIDTQPAGFSSIWLQQILREQMRFDGVIFSDDLSMQAACVAGDADARIITALKAGCDMGLVCNNRVAALLALRALQHHALPNQERLNRMRGRLGVMQGDQLALGDDWQAAVEIVQQLCQGQNSHSTFINTTDPTDPNRI
ncbi:MAG: beta-N-acetylhexosaminidase [Pseudomonadota bacterium]|nr:beta-N-acetylhexosaminidase [Pseudomonadota bacterium]